MGLQGLLEQHNPEHQQDIPAAPEKPSSTESSTQTSRTTTSADHANRMPPLVAHVASFHPIESQSNRAVIAVADQIITTVADQVAPASGSPRLTAQAPDWVVTPPFVD